MKTKNLIHLAVFFALVNLTTSCTKDEATKKPDNVLFTRTTQILDPTFSDSWGYLRALKFLQPNPQDSFITYSPAFLLATAAFLPSEGSTTHSQSGCGTLMLNDVNISPLFGTYIGTLQDYSRAVWTVGGNTLVPAFTDSLNTFIGLTGAQIPSWKAVTTTAPLTITIEGNTSNAYSLYVELEYKGATTSLNKYITKKLNPGEPTCTFSAAEMTELFKNNLDGLTLYVSAYTYKKITVGGKAFYLENQTGLSHAIYPVR